MIISEASCVAWCSRGELLFLLFPLTIKAAVALVNLRTKETEENNFECDVSALYVLILQEPGIKTIVKFHTSFE